MVWDGGGGRGRGRGSKGLGGKKSGRWGMRSFFRWV